MIAQQKSAADQTYKTSSGTGTIEVSRSGRQLLESLLYPIFAFREKYPNKDWSRLIQSMRYTLLQIEKFRDEETSAEQKYIKYHLDYILCKGTGQPRGSYPPLARPEYSEPLFTGYVQRMVARHIARARRGNTTSSSFLYSLQKGSKQAWPAMGDGARDKALAAHKERLGTHHGLLPDDLRAVIEKQSERIFGGKPKSAYSRFMPSGSACLQSSRNCGGALALYGNMRPVNSIFKSGDVEYIGKLPVLVSEVDRWRQDTFEKSYEDATTRLFAVARGANYPAGQGPLDQNVIALAEPGKFRVITLGCGYVNTALQPFQGALLDAWKKCKASTMLDSDLTERVRMIGRNCRSLPLWISVDYEAATDLIKKDGTLAALYGCRKWSGIDFVLSALREGTAVYPDNTSVKIKDAQLMGHPLSFPLLCVINLSVLECALDRWIEQSEGDPDLRNERISAKKLIRSNVLVNGDDMLFKCDETFYPIFAATAGDAGLKISVGKQYESTTHCMINSQFFVANSDDMHRCWYLNQRLRFGSIKGGNDGSTATPVGIAVALNELCDNLPQARMMIPVSMRRWQPKKGSRFQPNWYVPVHLGGYGIKPEHGPGRDYVVQNMTRDQFDLAARFWSDPALALYATHQNIPMPLAQVGAATLTHRAVSGFGPLKEDEIEAADDPWLQRLAYAHRAHAGVSNAGDWNTAAARSKFSLRTRLNPMSREKVVDLWYARWVAVRGPEAPPLVNLKYSELPNSITSALPLRDLQNDLFILVEPIGGRVRRLEKETDEQRRRWSRLGWTQRKGKWVRRNDEMISRSAQDLLDFPTVPFWQNPEPAPVWGELPWEYLRLW